MTTTATSASASTEASSTSSTASTSTSTAGQAASKANSELLLGTILRGPQEGTDLRMDLGSIIRHVLAVGTTGSGKSVILKILAESLLARRLPVVVCDVMGDLTGLALPARSASDYTDLGVPAPANLTDEMWSMAQAVAERLRPKIHARYITPCSDLGERLAVSPLPLRPKTFHDLYAEDRDDVELQASTAAGSLMERVGLKLPRLGTGGEAEMTRQVITETILEAWKRDLDLDGPEAFDVFLELLKGVSRNRFSDDNYQKMKIGLESLRTGQAGRWLEGARLDWDELFACPDGKAPLVIVAMDHLPREFHPWVVAQVVNSLFSWCASRGPAAGRPRVGLLIDELRGEGGRNSLLPPLTFSSPSGHALRRVLRQGRHFGLGLLAGTQSPRDIDGTNLPQFNSLFVGKLTADYDIRLMLGRSPMLPEDAKQVGDVIRTSSDGRFCQIRLNGTFEVFQARWLGTVHSSIPREQIRDLYQRGLLHRGAAASRPDSLTLWRSVGTAFCDPRRRKLLACDHCPETGWLVTAIAHTKTAGAHLRFAPGQVALLATWLLEIGDTQGVALLFRDEEAKAQLLKDLDLARLPFEAYRVTATGDGLVLALFQEDVAAGVAPVAVGRAVEPLRQAG